MFSKPLALLLLSTVSTPLWASPILNTDNGHYYELYTFTSDWRLDWNQAKAFAESLQHLGGKGYLATVTNEQEDDFLWNTLHAQGAFLGGFDTSTQTNTGVWQHKEWQWVTGEAFSYTNWMFREPNHWQDGSDKTPNNEDYLMYWAWSDGVGRWNDTNVDSSHLDGDLLKYTTRGFVVEFDPKPAKVDSKPVPLPASAWLFASGLLGLLTRKKQLA